MNKELLHLYPQPLYLLKVLTALAVLATIVSASFWLPLSGLSPVLRGMGIVALLALALAMVPLVRWVYHRMDELQWLLHQQSSMASLSMLASVSCLLGILQANQLVPLFNQFWTLALLVAVWGINLMLADQRFK
ncbi:MAG TPA: hypothetical protein VGE50_08090 [Gammaproteobacteria bacterium]